MCIGHVTTTRTRVPYVVATIGNHLWLGQVGNRGNPFAGIGSIRTRTKHGFALLVLMLEPQLYDKGSSGAIPKPGKDAIVSIFYGKKESPLAPKVHQRPYRMKKQSVL